MVYTKPPKGKENEEANKKIKAALYIGATALSATLLVADGVIRGPSYENCGEIAATFIFAMKAKGDLGTLRRKFNWSDKS